MFPVLFVIRRTGESTIAIVQANVSAIELADQSNFRDVLEKVVTDWVLSTDVGRGAWSRSVEDFNIGDLSNCIDESLTPLLAVAGIEDLHIECFSQGDCDWTFDRVLVDTTRLGDL